MTPEERERMLTLCQQIAIEKDHTKFGALIRELNDLLERKEKRIEPHPDDAGSGGFAESTKQGSPQTELGRRKEWHTALQSASGLEQDSSANEWES